MHFFIIKPFLLASFDAREFHCEFNLKEAERDTRFFVAPNTSAVSRLNSRQNVSFVRIVFSTTLQVVTPFLMEMVLEARSGATSFSNRDGSGRWVENPKKFSTKSSSPRFIESLLVPGREIFPLRTFFLINYQFTEQVIEIYFLLSIKKICSDDDSFSS